MARGNDVALREAGDNRGLQGFRRHKPGGAKTLGPSARLTPFPYNFHIGVRKIHLHIFFNFLKKFENNQSILTILTKYWVFSDLWTKFHFNQRPATFETWLFLEAFSSYLSLGVKVS